MPDEVLVDRPDGQRLALGVQVGDDVLRGAGKRSLTFMLRTSFVRLLASNDNKHGRIFPTGRKEKNIWGNLALVVHVVVVVGGVS